MHDQVIDEFGGVPEAPSSRRMLAIGLDVLAALGSPWLVLVACAPFVVPFIELIPLVVVALVVSTAAALVREWARRLPNGDRLTSGQLAAGLAILRTDSARRVVRAADIEGPRRPRHSRLLAGRIALGVTSLVAVAAISAASWATYTFVYQTATQQASDAEWQSLEPPARAACMAFVAGVLSDHTEGGATFAVDEAARSLPSYRAHLRRAGVTSLADEGWGGTSGEWEYSFAEKAGATTVQSVSIRVERRVGRFVVTQVRESAAVQDASVTGAP